VLPRRGILTVVVLELGAGSIVVPVCHRISFRLDRGRDALPYLFITRREPINLSAVCSWILSVRWTGSVSGVRREGAPYKLH
jgi:hypothetical protein